MTARHVAVLLLACVVLAAGCRRDVSGSSPSPDSAPPAATAHAAARGPAATSCPLISSAQRDVYHRAGCQWARRISAGNAVGYATAADAQADSRRPCQVCRP
jgi:hypothetical protein